MVSWEKVIAEAELLKKNDPSLIDLPVESVADIQCEEALIQSFGK